jgi:hypothetical protein
MTETVNRDRHFASPRNERNEGRDLPGIVEGDPDEVAAEATEDLAPASISCANA